MSASEDAELDPLVSPCRVPSQLLLIEVLRRPVESAKHWRSGKMAERWTAAASLEREKCFRRISGWRGLWILKRALERHTKEVAPSRTAA